MVALVGGRRHIDIVDTLIVFKQCARDRLIGKCVLGIALRRLGQCSSPPFAGNVFSCSKYSTFLSFFNKRRTNAACNALPVLSRSLFAGKRRPPIFNCPACASALLLLLWKYGGQTLAAPFATDSGPRSGCFERPLYKAFLP